MELSDSKKYEYTKSQLVEVICQLRFPTILSIQSKEPADFQDAVRESFPRYAVADERLPAGPGSEMQTVKNHSFISSDGKYKLSLTKSFIALSTLSYTNWTDFAKWLDEPLGHFISIYRPAYFERVGLRYVNAFSKKSLGLDACRWAELIVPEYLGLLDVADRDEDVLRSSLDTELRLDEKARVKLHAGPGVVKRAVRTPKGVQAIPDSEVRFIFDQDVCQSGNIPLAEAAGTLQTLHTHADDIFSRAITDKLHDAMQPVYSD